MIAVSGSNGSGAIALAARLRGAVKDAPAQEPPAVAPTVLGLLEADYSARVEPTSRARWAPRKPPTGGWPLLEKTGRMRASLLVRWGRGKLTLSFNTPAEYHQRGNLPRMVARPPLPIDRLSPVWQDAIAKARAEWWRRKVLG